MITPEVEAGRAFVQMAVVPFVACVLAVVAALIATERNNKMILGLSAVALGITAATLLGRGITLIESGVKKAPTFPVPVFPRRGSQV